MQWARDVVEVAGTRTGIRSARSLLTAMTRAMDVGMVEDRIEIEIPASAISSDAIAGTETATTDGNADAVIAIVIGTTDAGAVGGKNELTPKAFANSSPGLERSLNPGDAIKR